MKKNMFNFLKYILACLKKSFKKHVLLLKKELHFLSGQGYPPPLTDPPIGLLRKSKNHVFSLYTSFEELQNQIYNADFGFQQRVWSLI